MLTGIRIVTASFYAWCASEWQHLKMLKRAGQGHTASGVDGTSAGECTVLCPECPQPGKNLPPDWKEALKEKRWAAWGINSVS